MNFTPHDVNILAAVICITIIGVVYIMNGGDGFAMTGAMTAISAVLGFKMGEVSGSKNYPKE